MSSERLTSFLFSTPEMADIFSAQAQLRAMTRFEWALSSALEANGLAEPGSAVALRSCWMRILLIAQPLSERRGMRGTSLFRLCGS